MTVVSGHVAVQGASRLRGRALTIRDVGSVLRRNRGGPCVVGPDEPLARSRSDGTRYRGSIIAQRSAKRQGVE